MIEWGNLSRFYPGWTLSEIKDLTPADRKNWFEIARSM
jgi:hypothetical protein